jgi:hypothetical protein
MIVALDAGRWLARMDVERHVERRGGFQDRPIFRIVEVFAIRMRVDDEALQAELRHRAVEFRHRCCGRLHRHARESGIARRIGLDRVGEPVVRQPCQREAFVRIELLNARRGE